MTMSLVGDAPKRFGDPMSILGGEPGARRMINFMATRASRAELNHALADGVDSINKIHVLASGPR